jgi:ATP-dependent DNA helicase RecG
VPIDLSRIAARESEQVEWKENVADIDEVVQTLSAFANDLQNLGGGYVVCGAKEERDDYGFARIVRPGLSAARLKEVEGKVLDYCRARVSPPITPLTEEIPSDAPDCRLLVFVIAATKPVHSFRGRDGTTRVYVRLGRNTIEARNGMFLQLMVRKGDVEPWDLRACPTATVEDIDRLALGDALQRMGALRDKLNAEDFLSDTRQVSEFVPPLCAREPLSGLLRPRNFTMLLFGRSLQRHVPGAYSAFSSYPGTDRAARHSERIDLAGTVLDQAHRLIGLLDAQASMIMDKGDPVRPNAFKYPKKALHEAMVNALAHRDYTMPDPVRVTAFDDRIEILSPGSLPLGVGVEDLSESRAFPKWRNKGLSWFFRGLQLAQADAQGVATIYHAMRAEGCPPPRFDANEGRVECTLPAHPRHAAVRLKYAATSQADGESLGTAAQRLRANDFPVAAAKLLESEHGLLDAPPGHLLDLADVLAYSVLTDSAIRDLAARVYVATAGKPVSGREAARIAAGLGHIGNHQAALDALADVVRTQPDLATDPWLLRARADLQLMRAVGNGPESIVWIDRAIADLETALSHAEAGDFVIDLARRLKLAESLRRDPQHRLDESIQLRF